MRTGYDYLKNEILRPILDIDKSNFELSEIFDEKAASSEEFEKFAFHINLISDSGFILNNASGHYSEPFLHSMGPSRPSVSPLEMSLSAHGQAFAENLCSAEAKVLEKIKGLGIDVVKGVLPDLIS
jgi:hypothetical protein